MKKGIAFILCCICCLALFSGCGEEAGTVTVESVATVCGVASGLHNRYAGIVTAGDTVEVKKDDDKTVLECLVKAGDAVQSGDVLFTYDTAQMELDLQKAKLELEQLQNSISALTAQKAELEGQRSAAGESQQLAYTVQIQEAENDIREAQYNASVKEAEIQRLEGSMSVTEVTAPVSGTVQAVNESGTDSQGNAAAYIVITESGIYRVKGLVSELNAGELQEGMALCIRSRTDETQTWSGTLTGIDWEKPETNTNTSMYYSDAGEMTTASRYPFYVELEQSNGLLLGQHVYIESAEGETGTALCLPEYYICDIDSDPFVWAESEKGTLEKRGVVLGSHDEEMRTYEITEGLTAQDSLAFPDDTLTVGMLCQQYEETVAELGEDDVSETDTGGIDGPEEIVVEAAP